MTNRNKFEGNASLLTHWRHWLQLDGEADTDKQVLEHPTQPRNSYHSSNTGLKALAHAVALAAFLSVELLIPRFLKSKCDGSPRSLSEEEAEGMWGTAPALTFTEQLCPLLTTKMYLLINLVFLDSTRYCFLAWLPHSDTSIYLIQRRILTRDTRTSRRDGKEQQMGTYCYLFSFHKSYDFMAPHRQKTPARVP